MTDAVPVTQDDKEAAADCAHALGIDLDTFMSGAADILVQAFARHRMSADLATSAAALRDAGLLAPADYHRTINRIDGARERPPLQGNRRMIGFYIDGRAGGGGASTGIALTSVAVRLFARSDQTIQILDQRVRPVPGTPDFVFDRTKLLSVAISHVGWKRLTSVRHIGQNLVDERPDVFLCDHLGEPGCNISQGEKGAFRSFVRRIVAAVSRHNFSDRMASGDQRMCKHAAGTRSITSAQTSQINLCCSIRPGRSNLSNSIEPTGVLWSRVLDLFGDRPKLIPVARNAVRTQGGVQQFGMFCQRAHKLFVVTSRHPDQSAGNHVVQGIMSALRSTERLLNLFKSFFVVERHGCHASSIRHELRTRPENPVFLIIALTNISRVKFLKELSASRFRLAAGRLCRLREIVA